MKAYQLLSGALLLLTLTVSCAADPETLQPDRNERYAREFIKEFGVPDANHDYSMATSAGLKVTTAKGGHVMVTAEIDGTEYLFADLDVPAGTHALPVTIPRSVTQLKVTSDYGEQLVPTDATVNIDKMTTGRSTIGNSVFSDDGSPIIAFKPSDFLDAYFKENPMGQDNKPIGFYHDFARNYLKLNVSDPIRPSYIFPIWWRSETEEIKDYKVYAKSNWGNQTPMPIGNRLLFGDKEIKNIPFPELGYTFAYNDYSEIDLSKFPDNIIKDNGSAIMSYPYSSASNNDDMIILSRGKSFYTDKTEQISLTVTKNNDNLLSSTIPEYNRTYWSGNYFDTELSNLYTALSSIKWTYAPGKRKYHIYENGQWFTMQGDALLVGFNAPPTSKADKAIRDYSDVIFLILNAGYSGGKRPLYSYEWTIAAEDLGGSDDWDFNDAVFQFTDVIQNLSSINVNNEYMNAYGGLPDSKTVRCITVKPLAAGGTMPIYITYTGEVSSMPLMPTGAEADGAELWYSETNNAIIEHINNAPTMSGTYIIGKELHKWLGGNTHISPINVGNSRSSHKAQEIKFAIPTFWNPYNKTYKYPTSTSIDNIPLNGFAILVDKNNELNIDAMGEGKDGFQLMPNHTLGQGTYMIGAPNEDKNLIAPQMILVDKDWEWPQERVNIKDAYPDFAAWISNSGNSKWHTNQNQNKVTKK